LQDIIKHIYLTKKSAELDPNKTEKNDDLRKNFNYLHATVDALVKKIFLRYAFEWIVLLALRESWLIYFVLKCGLMPADT
jgi:hypothetical protein